MSHDGRTITGIKSKANVFINHCARVSKLNMSRADRDRQFKKRLNAPSADDQSCALLQMSELHLKKLTTSLTYSLRIIRAIAHTSWGWHHSTLKMAFHTLIRSKLDYAAPAWQPWLSATNLSCLDRVQNRSLRLITGQFVSSPLEALCLEADVQSYHTCSNRLILKAREMALRTTDECVALATDIPQYLQNLCTFRRKANDLSTLLPPELQHQQTINHFPSTQ